MVSQAAKVSPPVTASSTVERGGGSSRSGRYERSTDLRTKLSIAFRARRKQPAKFLDYDSLKYLDRWRGEDDQPHARCSFEDTRIQVRLRCLMRPTAHGPGDYERDWD